MAEKEKKQLEEEAKTNEPEPTSHGEDTAGKGAKSNEKCDKHSKKGELEKELEDVRASAEDYKRKWYAVAAEYDNYRKRTQSATSQAYQDGKAEAILKLLPVADTFGYAYDGASDEKTKTGIDKIIKNFNSIINSLGVEEIPVSAGDAFDESTMEAVMNVPCEEGEAANTVKMVLKKGYRREGKVIRFAQVSVTV